MHAAQFGFQSRSAQAHQFAKRMFTFEFAARGLFLLQLTGVLRVLWKRLNADGRQQD